MNLNTRYMYQNIETNKSREGCSKDWNIHFPVKVVFFGITQTPIFEVHGTAEKQEKNPYQPVIVPEVTSLQEVGLLLETDTHRDKKSVTNSTKKSKFYIQLKPLRSIDFLNNAEYSQQPGTSIKLIELEQPGYPKNRREKFRFSRF